MTPAAITDALCGISLLAATFYGFVFLVQPVGWPRTLAKTLAVGSLAVVSLVVRGPWPLTAALALSAVGDAFLAGDPKKWLPFGLGAFLLAHLLYIVLFAGAGLGLAGLAADPLRLFGALAALALAAAMLIWLWPTLGDMRWTVSAYVLVIAAMVVFALALPMGRAMAMAGAVLFFASDTILAVRLFRRPGPNLVGDLAVWWFYWAAQALIAAAFLRTAV